MGGDPHRFTLGVAITALLFGTVCLGGGVALLAWRIFTPENAVILPPGVINTAENTPTPGVLSVPLMPPPLPFSGAEVVILPVSDLPSPTPTDVVPSPTAIPSAALTVVSPPTHTPARTSTTILSLEPTRGIVTISPTATPFEQPDLPDPAVSPIGTVLYTLPRIPAPTHTPTSPSVTFLAAPDRIVIEKIGLDAPVVPVGQHPIQIGGRIYSQWDVPDERAAGWHQNSAPLGQSGNTVLNGHHNVNGAVFRYLVTLELGDMVALNSGEDRYLYVVAQTMALEEEGQSLTTRQNNARWILPTNDERVTLITCWPLDASTHRLVVIALSARALDQLTGIP